MYQLTSPQQVILGAGCVQELPGLLAPYEGKPVCVVMDPFILQGEQGRQLVHAIERMHSVTVIDGVRGEPTFGQVEALAAAQPLDTFAAFVAVGGGSVIDTAKVLSAIATNPPLASRLEDSSAIVRQPAPLYAVPTTAGTGAEATPNAILLHEGKKQKIGIVSPKMIARCVLLDSDMTESLPPALVASTGMDALAHALESFVSKKESPFHALYALEAISLVFRHLQRACLCNTAAAREGMLLASYYAGLCLVTGSTSAVHAIAYPLSGLYHVPHGVSIAALLPPFLRLAEPDCRPRMAQAARYAGLAPAHGQDDVATAALLERLEALTQAIGARYHMEAYGVQVERHVEMARDGRSIRRLMDLSPRDMTLEEIVALYAEIQ